MIEFITKLTILSDSPVSVSFNRSLLPKIEVVPLVLDNSPQNLGVP